MLLFRDLIRLFAGYNDSIINLLEKYFDMNKKQCRDALDLYKKFLIRMDRVGEFLKVAENVGIDKGEIPDLTKAPSSLLDALEQHLASIEGKKSAANTPTQATSTHRTDVKTGVSALSSTSSSFGTIAQQADGVEESLKQAVLAEEEAVLNQYKAKVNSPVNGTIASVNNPFLVSSEPIVDLFSCPTPATQMSTKASDDLLQLSNPFADMFSTPMTGSQTNASNDMSSPLANNWMSNGFNTNSSNAFVDDKSFTSVFGQPESNQSCPAPTTTGAPDSGNKKVLTGDLDSSLASLAENLTINKVTQPPPVQWNSPKNTPKPGNGQPGMGWSPQPMAATTGANYRPMGVQPSCIGGSAVGGGNLGMTAPSSSQTSQPQPVLDPFGL